MEDDIIVSEIAITSGMTTDRESSNNMNISKKPESNEVSFDQKSDLSKVRTPQKNIFAKNPFLGGMLSGNFTNTGLNLSNKKGYSINPLLNFGTPSRSSKKVVNDVATEMGSELDRTPITTRSGMVASKNITPNRVSK